MCYICDLNSIRRLTMERSEARRDLQRFVSRVGRVVVVVVGFWWRCLRRWIVSTGVFDGSPVWVCSVARSNKLVLLAVTVSSSRYGSLSSSIYTFCKPPVRIYHTMRYLTAGVSKPSVYSKVSMVGAVVFSSS
jgi:hypothetical protein